MGRQTDIPTLLPREPMAMPGDSQPQASETARRLYAEVAPALVQLQTETNYVGSGFFVDSSGHAVTAAHVVVDAKQLTAKTTDGREYPVTIEKIDDTHDLAELKVVGLNGKPKYLQFEDAEPSLGEPAFALGYPKGVRPAYISPGTVAGATQVYELLNKTAASYLYKTKSGSERDDLVEALTLNMPKLYMHTEHGNSGGPVVNSYGRVIGITEMSDDSKQTLIVGSDHIKRMIDNPEQKFDFNYACDAKISTNRSELSLRPFAGYTTEPKVSPAAGSVIAELESTAPFGAYIVRNWKDNASKLLDRFFNTQASCVPTLRSISRTNGSHAPVLRFKSLPLLSD